MAELKEPNFEISMKRLGEIVEKLEAGDMPLDESLKLYEEGVRTSQACMKRLEQAQQRIEVLMRGTSGAMEAEEVDADTLKAKTKKSKKQ